MDVFCSHCGEPWDIYSIHEIVGGSYNHKNVQFQQLGCGAFEVPPVECQAVTPEAGSPMDTRAQAAGAMYDLLGDDMDGAASMLDDAEAMGLFD
jgi:hypothetical protein